jgi:hypothetical protein
MNEIILVLAGACFIALAFDVGRHRSRSGFRDTPGAALEPLEPRIAPAALAASFRDGVLSIIGDPEGTMVNVLQGPNAIEVFDGGTSLGMFSGVKNIRMIVEGGASIGVDLSSNGIKGSLAVLAGGATDLTIVAGSTFGGGLSFKGDSATQSLDIQTGVLIGKALKLNGGAGIDNFTIREGVTVNANMTFTAVENGQFFGENSSSTCGGSVLFKNASTPHPVVIGFVGQNPLIIGENVKYVGGSGNDQLRVNATFRNGLFLDDAGINEFILANGSALRGNVKMITGGGIDVLNVQGGTIEGNVTLRLGEGNNRFTYGIAAAVSIGGSVKMATGSGDDDWRTFGGRMTIGGDVSINLGGGTNKVIASANLNGTNLTINTGAGDDVVSIDGMAANTDVRISLGEGADELAGTLLRANASATFDGGGGTDRFVENLLTTEPLVIIGFENFT